MRPVRLGHRAALAAAAVIVAAAAPVDRPLRRAVAHAHVVHARPRLTAIPAIVLAPSAAPPAAPAAVAGMAGLPPAPPPVLPPALPQEPAPGSEPVMRLDQTQDTVLVPAASDVGAAAFRRGPWAVVALDRAKNLDLAAVAGDPVFGQMQATRLPTGTVILVPVPSQTPFSLFHSPQGWEIRIGGAPSAAAAIDMSVADGQTRLAAASSGGVVLVQDPVTGDTLMVGTQRHEGQAVMVARRRVEFALLPSVTGVAVLPQADRVDVRATPQGFAILASAAPALSVETETSAAVPDDAAALTRRFDLARLPPQDLRLRLAQQLHAAAALPRLARFPARLAEVQTLLALGMAAEAQSLAQLAMAEDPARQNDAQAVGLAGVAALLAGRDAEAGGLDDPRLTGTDEIALWRALRLAGPVGDRPNAAPAIAATWKLLLRYPDALRERLLPIAAIALLRGGQGPAAAALLAAAPDAPGLGLARGIALAQAGHVDAALGVLDEAGRGHDQRLQAQARREAVEVRLASGKIGAGEAADQLCRQFLAWRDGDWEFALRLRAAELRREAAPRDASAWRQALALLRETDGMFPDRHEKLRQAEAATLQALLSGDAAGRMAPLDLVALADENSDLLSQDDENAKLAPILVDKLLALDLPDRADPILRKLAADTQAPVPRAALGQRLAALLLGQGDTGGARQALDASEAADLPASVAEGRGLLAARIAAAGGDVAGALRQIATLSGSEALELRAGWLAQQGDWHGAEAALSSLALSLPTAGALDERGQSLILRLAEAASQANDAPELAQLRERMTPRFAPGAKLDQLRLLVAAPVLASADLGRSAAEIAVARSVAAQTPPVP